MSTGGTDSIRIENELFEFRFLPGRGALRDTHSTAQIGRNGGRGLFVLKDLVIALPLAASIRLGRKLATASPVFECIHTAGRGHDSLGPFREALIVFRRQTRVVQLIWHARLYLRRPVAVFTIEALNTTKTLHPLRAMCPVEVAMGELPASAAIISDNKRTALSALGARELPAAETLAVEATRDFAFAFGFADGRCARRLVRVAFPGQGRVSCLCLPSKTPDGYDLAPSARFRSDALVVASGRTSRQALDLLADAAGRYKGPPPLWGA